MDCSIVQHTALQLGVKRESSWPKTLAYTYRIWICEVLTLFVCFWGKDSRVQAGLKLAAQLRMTLTNCLPASSTECESYKHAPPCPVCLVLGIKLKAPCVLDQHSIREHSPPPKSWPFRNDKEKSKTSAKTWRRDVSLETGSFLLTTASGWRFLVTQSYHLISFPVIFESYTLRERLDFVHSECEGGPSHVSETRDGGIFCQFSLLISWKTLSFWLWLSGVKGRISPCEVVSWFLFWT